MKTILETDMDFICDINAPCFQLLEKDEIDLIQSGKTQVQFRKGDSITKQGAFASYVLFMVKGLAKQYIEGVDNKSFNIKIVTPGDFVGLSSVFDRVIFDYSTIALTDCQAFLIEKEAVSGLVKKNGNFGFSITRRYCKQNHSLFKTISNLLYKQMNGRLAGALLYLDEINSKYPELYGLLNRKDIAGFCGISTENCVKLLESFEKDGIIKLSDKQIIIKDKNVVELIASRG